MFFVDLWMWVFTPGCKHFFIHLNFEANFYCLVQVILESLTEVRSTEASLKSYPPKTQEQKFHTCWNLFFHGLVFNFHVKPNLQIQAMWCLRMLWPDGSSGGKAESHGSSCSKPSTSSTSDLRNFLFWIEVPRPAPGTSGSALKAVQKAGESWVALAKCVSQKSKTLEDYRGVKDKIK